MKFLGTKGKDKSTVNSLREKKRNCMCGYPSSKVQKPMIQYHALSCRGLEVLRRIYKKMKFLDTEAKGKSIFNSLKERK
jgi:hypothetical protein